MWTGQIRCTPERLEWKRRHKQQTWVPAKCGACRVPVRSLGTLKGMQMAWEEWLGRATRKNEGEPVSVPLGGPAPRGCSWVGRGAEAGSSGSPLLSKGTPGPF